jgi:hypothetical protein
MLHDQDRLYSLRPVTITEGTEVKSRILQLLLVPVVAFAVLLTGTNTVRAAPATQQAAIEAKAIQTVQAVEKSLRATGSAVFTGADGTVHRISLSATSLVVDGQVTAVPVQPDGSVAPADWKCNIKVGLAIAAITAVGAIGIWAWIAGLPVTAPVTIAGLTFTAGTWSTIASILASGGSLVAILQGLLC